VTSDFWPPSASLFYGRLLIIVIDHAVADLPLKRGNFMKYFSCIVLIGCLGFGVAGCQKKSGPASQAIQPVAVQPRNLDGLSMADTLTTKYDKAELHCQLDFPFLIQKNGSGQKYSGSDSFKWDLLHDYAETKTFELKAQSGPIALLVELQIQKITLGSVNFHDGETGKSYQMQYSPLVEGLYRYKLDNPIVIGNGVSDENYGHGPFSLYESIGHKVINEAAGSQMQGGSGGFNFEIHLACTLDTKIKAEYQNQYSIISN